LSSGKKTLTGKKNLTAEKADRTSFLTLIFEFIVQNHFFLNDLNHHFPEAKFVQKPELGARASDMTTKAYKRLKYTLEKVSRRERCIKIEGGI